MPLSEPDLGRGAGWDWMESLRCPACLGPLRLDPAGGGIVKASGLTCGPCRLAFAVRDGVAIFGVPEKAKQEALQEIAAEDRWHFRFTQDEAHLQFAQLSFRIGERIIRRLEELVPAEDTVRVLDLGAGAGPFSWALARRGYRVMSSDISLANMLVAAGYVERGSFFGRLVGHSGLLPFESSYFDVVFSKELMHHVPDLVGELRECGRVLKPGGLLVLHDPMWPIRQRPNEDAATAQGIHHVYRNALGHLRSLKRAGFTVCDVLDHRGPVNPKRSPILAALDRMLVHTLNLDDWSGPLMVKALRSTILGGSMTTIAKWSWPRTPSHAQTDLCRGVVPMDPQLALDEVEAVERATGELVPRLVGLFAEIEREADNELRSRIESLLVSERDGRSVG